MRQQSGDTLVEVLLATVILSVVLAAAFALTNRATRLNQTAVERTTATNLMREQIEIIRGARTNDTLLWSSIPKSSSTPPDYTDCKPTTSGFYVTANSDSTSPFTARGNADAYDDLFDVWVEAYKPSGEDEYIDFHVRACWEGIGGEHEQRAALVLRLAV